MEFAESLHTSEIPELLLRAKKNRKMHSKLRLTSTSLPIHDEELKSLSYYAHIDPDLTNKWLHPVGWSHAQRERLATLMRAVKCNPSERLALLQFARTRFLLPSDEQIKELLCGEEAYFALLEDALTIGRKTEDEVLSCEAVSSLALISQSEAFLSQILGSQFCEGIVGELRHLSANSAHLFLQEHALFSLNNFASLAPALVITLSYCTALQDLLTRPHVPPSLTRTALWGLSLVFKTADCSPCFHPSEQYLRKALLALDDRSLADPIMATDLMSCFKNFTRKGGSRLLFFFRSGLMQLTLKALESEKSCVVQNALLTLLHLTRGGYTEIERALTSNLPRLFQCFEDNPHPRPRESTLKVLLALLSSSQSFARVFVEKKGIDFLLFYLAEPVHQRIRLLLLKMLFSVSRSSSKSQTQVAESPLIPRLFNFALVNLHSITQSELVVLALNTCAVCLQHFLDKAPHRLAALVEEFDFFTNLEAADQSTPPVQRLALRIRAQFGGSCYLGETQEERAFPRPQLEQRIEL